MATRTDGELIRVYAESGDDTAFAELVSRHQQAVYRACLRMLGDSHEAQDAAQATFIVLVRKARDLRKEGSLSGWLHNVARKVALEAIRRRTVRIRREEVLVGQFAAGNRDAESEADVEIVLKSVDEALGELSERLREAVILRYVQGYSQKDGAELARCPQGTFGRRTHDGLAKLRERLVKRGIPVSAVTLVIMVGAESQAATPETLLSSITSASKAVAAGAATGAGATPAVLLAKGVMKTMLITKIKFAAMVVAGAVVLGGVTMVAVQAASDRSERQPMRTATTTAADRIPSATDKETSTNSPFWQYGMRMGKLALLNTRRDLGKATVREQQMAAMNEMFELSKVIDGGFQTNLPPHELRNVIEGAMSGSGVHFEDGVGPALDRLCEDFVRRNTGTTVQYDTTTFTLRCSDNICVLVSNVLDLVRKEEREKVRSVLPVLPLNDDAMMKEARATITSIAAACRAYQVDTGRLPTSLENLVRDSGKGGWRGPYLKTPVQSVPADPWGRMFRYTRKDTPGFSVVSAGPDGEFGTSDDVSN